MRVAGEARVSFARGDGGATRLASVYQHDPMRVLFPDPLHDPMPAAVLINTSGGLVGGDTVAIDIDAGPAAAARVTTQAAERVYRSAGPTVSLAASLGVGAGAWLEWLPNETILFDAARLSRRLAITLAAGARCLAAEMTVFGRVARGERFARGALSERWEIRRDGRLLWADALRLDGDVAAAIDHPAGFGGAAAHAIVVCAGAGAAAALPALRAICAGDHPFGASAIGDVLVMRGLARDPAVLRAAHAEVVAAARAAFGGWPAAVPPSWTF